MVFIHLEKENDWAPKLYDDLLKYIYETLTGSARLQDGDTKNSCNSWCASMLHFESLYICFSCGWAYKTSKTISFGVLSIDDIVIINERRDDIHKPLTGAIERF